MGVGVGVGVGVGADQKPMRIMANAMSERNLASVDM